MADGPVSTGGVPFQRTQPGLKYSTLRTTRLTTIPSHQTYSQQLPSNVGTNNTEPAITPSSPGLHATSVTKPLVIHFKARLAGLTIGASLLPSLRAQYKVSTRAPGLRAQYVLVSIRAQYKVSTRAPESIRVQYKVSTRKKCNVI